MADNNFAFRRETDPFQLLVDTTAQQFTVPGGGAWIRAMGYTSFWVCNPNGFWVRLKGSVGTYSAVAATTGWCFPPGFVGALSTQFPDFMSALSITKQGMAAGAGVLEISYGGGV